MRHRRGVAAPARRLVVGQPNAMGLTVREQIEAMERNGLDLWCVAATNPPVSLPLLNRVHAPVAGCPLVVLTWRPAAASKRKPRLNWFSPPPSEARRRV